MQYPPDLNFFYNSYPHAVDIFSRVLWLRKNIFVLGLAKKNYC